jgi:DNA-directed RNA polymerase subunit RPC12/RpoP
MVAQTPYVKLISLLDPIVSTAMTDVHFHCAICGTALTVAGDAAGAVEECRACGRQVPVPALIHLNGGTAGCAPLFPEEILGVELKFRCARCATKLRIDVRWEGREVPCPKCNLQLKVPRWSRPAVETRASNVARLSPAEVEFLSGSSAKPAVA